MNNGRLKIIVFVVFLLFSAIVTRLFYWQVIHAEKLAAMADSQHFISLDLPATRGNILAFDKTPLVTNETAYLFYGDLRNLEKDHKEIAAKLAPLLIKDRLATASGDAEAWRKEIIGKEQKKLESYFGLKEVIWVPLAHKIPRETKNRIEKLNFEGLGFEEETKRFYPEGSMSAQLLGFVGKDTLGNDLGYFGLEGKYDLQLKGQNGKLRTEKDALGRPILFGNEDTVNAKEGRTLLTTIDKYIQMQTEKYLREGIDAWGAKGGNVIVMEPKSGAILAMAAFPSYDPGDYGQFSSEDFRNPNISETFEPGSIMKPVIMSIALEKNKVKPQTTCPVCAGPRQIGEYFIKTFNEQYHPGLNMTEVLVNSDNTGMVFIGERTGKENVYNYLQKYGFGNSTGIDLNDEEEGFIKPLSDWYPIDAATITFGQGIAVTPIQMARAFCVIANGGKLVKPFVVQKIIDDGKEIEIAPGEGRRIISTAVTKVLTEMLVKVNDESPLHFPKDRIPGLSRYRIAAKSGTAQIPLAGHYDETKTIASVIGYAPADEPKFLIYVRLLEPSVRIWGSDTAGPIFYKLVNDLLVYYAIPPDY